MVSETLAPPQPTTGRRAAEIVRRSRWPQWYFLVTALIPGHLLNWTVEWGFAVVTTVGGAILYPQFHRRHRAVSTAGFSVVALITLFSAWSYLFTLVDGRFATGPRDWIDLLRPFMVYLSCALGFGYGCISLGQARRLCRYVLLVTVVVTAVLVVDVPLLSGIAQAVYGSTKTAISTTLLRVSVPFENPNFLGLFSVITLACALLFGGRPDFVLAILALFAIAVTGSRTAWLTTGIIVTVFFGTLLWHAAVGTGGPRGRNRGRTFAVAVIVLLVILRYLPTIVETNQRFLDFMAGLASLDLLRDPAYVERQVMRAEAWRLINERLLLGWGALKNTNIDIVDNQYISLLIRSGVVGAAILAAGLGGLFRRHLAYAARHHARLGVCVLWAVTFAWLWSGSFAENIRLSVLGAMMFASTVTVDDDSAA